MEIHDPNLHLKLIEMCDCYLETDFKAQIQMATKTASGDIVEDSVKYLALAIMYALTEKAQKLTFKNKKGQLTVTLKMDGDTISMKAPSVEIFDQIISIMRTILHLADDNASMMLALGLRSGQVDIQVKVERKDNKEALRLKFSDLD
ncbi:MAG: hypothetical protein KKB30_00375 [Proteobacteria bacterium]|nr:hypothetical protein [Pseudomonadota bacterium]MBU1716671.1 hypothetical protein [Pseudomonadota bacterium]